MSKLFVRILGVVFIVLSIPALFLAFIGGISGYYGPRDPTSLFIDVLMRVIFIGTPVVLFLSGFGLLLMQKWGRLLTLIASTAFALGTAIYGVSGLLYDIRENIYFSSTCFLLSLLFIGVLVFLGRKSGRALFH